MTVMVPKPRESWTDERLDDFRENVSQRFDAVDKRLDRIEGELQELRRRMFQGFIAMVGIMVTGFLTLAGLIVF